MKEFARYSGGLLLAAVLLWWVLKDTDPAVIWRQLISASPIAALLCVGLNLGHNVFRVWRWRVLLDPVRRGVGFRTMMAAVIIGYMTSWVIPGRLGELVRPLLLSAREDVPLGPAIGSVVADRLLDAATVVALFVLGGWITPLQGRAAEYGALLRSGSVVLAVFVAGGVAAMLAASMNRDRLRRWLTGRSRPLRWIGRTTISVATGVDALRSPRHLALVVLLSASAWLTIALGIWFGILAVGAEVSFGVVLVILPMLVLGVAVPTPGGAGTYHGAMKLGLMLFGVSELLAVSAGLLIHAMITVPIVLCGVVFLWTERVEWRDLVASASRLRHLGSPIDAPDVGRAAENTP